MLALSTGSQLGRATYAAPQLLVPFRRSPFCTCKSTTLQGPTRHRSLPWKVQRQHSILKASSEDVEVETKRTAQEGDTVTLNFSISNKDDMVLIDTANNPDEKFSFVVGAGDVINDKIIQAFDTAVRGRAVGEDISMEASGAAWDPELYFQVPREHEEIQRLEGRYQNVGGLQPGLVVELSNGYPAVILDVTDEEVEMDANDVLAGKELIIRLEITNIERI